jgi:hypothetical protein
VFFDANYEPDTPVPVLNCRCRDWPAAADGAELRIWCLPQAVLEAEEVPLADVANHLPPSGDGFALQRISGVVYQVRQSDPAPSGKAQQIRVVQRHEPGTSVHAVKLDLSPRPVRCVHQFDGNLGIVLHTFEYDADQPPAVASTTLRFQRRDLLTSSAWRLDQPVLLTIAKHKEVIAPPRIVTPGRKAE